VERSREEKEGRGGRLREEEQEEESRNTYILQVFFMSIKTVM